MEKELYAIYHVYDEDGGFGDAVTIRDMVGAVWATKEELDAFLKQWDKPEVCGMPYDTLFCHAIEAEALEPTDISKFKPYSTDPDDWFNKGIKQCSQKLLSL